MRHVECARCGYDIRGMGMRDFKGRYIHQRCPTQAERGVNTDEPEAEPTTLYRIVSKVRAFCRLDLDHAKCAGVTVTGERIAQVCACTCHLNTED